MQYHRFFTNATIARTAFTKHQNAHTFKSVKLPARTNPKNEASPKRTISAIFPPFLSLFLVATDTIPPDNINIARIMPPLPLDSPLFDNAL